MFLLRVTLVVGGAAAPCEGGARWRRQRCSAYRTTRPGARPPPQPCALLTASLECAQRTATPAARPAGAHAAGLRMRQVAADSGASQRTRGVARCTLPRVCAAQPPRRRQQRRRQQRARGASAPARHHSAVEAAAARARRYRRRQGMRRRARHARHRCERGACEVEARAAVGTSEAPPTARLLVPCASRRVHRRRRALRAARGRPPWGRPLRKRRRARRACASVGDSPVAFLRDAAAARSLARCRA
jgi:hypothetical protein